MSILPPPPDSPARIPLFGGLPQGKSAADAFEELATTDKFEELPPADLEDDKSAARNSLQDFDNADEVTPYRSNYPPPLDTQAELETRPFHPAPVPGSFPPSSLYPAILERRPLMASAGAWGAFRASAASARDWLVETSSALQRRLTDGTLGSQGASDSSTPSVLIRAHAPSQSVSPSANGGARPTWRRTSAPYVVGLIGLSGVAIAAQKAFEPEPDSSAAVHGLSPTNPEALPTPETAFSKRSTSGAASPSSGRGAHAERASTEVAAEPASDEAAILVTLAESLLAERQDAEAVRVLERALLRNPKLSKDAPFVDVLKRTALSADRSAATSAYALLTGPMGERGAEILYEFSLPSAPKSSIRERAEAWVQTKDFERKAPLTLYAALKLRGAESCEEKKNLLGFAAEAGGRHVLEYLKELDAHKVCSLDDLENCHSCMNFDDALPRAIAELESRLDD